MKIKVKNPMNIPPELRAKYSAMIEREAGGLSPEHKERLSEMSAVQAYLWGDPEGGVREVDEKTLAISGMIAEETYEALAERMGEGSKIETIRISSTGGIAYCGVGCYNLLREAAVRIEVDGMAFSAASVIAMAGSPVVIKRAATLGIHRPWGIAMGNVDDLQEEAAILDTLGDAMFEAYSARVKGKRKRAEVWSLYQKDSLLSGKEAVRLGLADEYEAADDDEDSKAVLAEAKEPVKAAPQAERLSSRSNFLFAKSNREK